jgi:predicted signal transduction protein with EAL and GGDEF domain
VPDASVRPGLARHRRLRLPDRWRRAAEVADIALFRAKADGRNMYRFFDSAMHGEIQVRQALERDLRRAVLQNEFVVHYPPLVNLESGQITGFEALIRWNHPERESLLPLTSSLLRKRPGSSFRLANACFGRHVKRPHDGRTASVSP